MRIEKEKSIFIALDYQEKLMPAIMNADRILKKTQFLMKGLKELDVPMIMTTQYAKGLGYNVPFIREMIGDERNYDKVTFSIGQDEAVMQFLAGQDVKYVLIGGAETHICVLQSVIDLAAAGYVPVLVTDCIGSRHSEDREAGLVRAQQEGALITTSEALLYELAVTAKHPRFKQISSLVKEMDRQ